MTLTCLACQLPIYRGQRAISLEFGQVEQSQKSQRDIIKGYAVDTIHFGCIQDYLGRIDGELYESIMAHHKQVIRKQIVIEMRDELRQEIYDEVVDELGRTCAVCHDEIEEAGEEDDNEKEEEDPDPIVRSAMVQGPQPPSIPWPVLPFPNPLLVPNGHNK
jgi:hypothetical protein